MLAGSSSMPHGTVSPRGRRLAIQFQHDDVPVRRVKSPGKAELRARIGNGLLSTNVDYTAHEVRRGRHPGEDTANSRLPHLSKQFAPGLKSTVLTDCGDHFVWVSPYA